jgi:hypothetical protein
MMSFAVACRPMSHVETAPGWSFKSKTRYGQRGLEGNLDWTANSYIMLVVRIEYLETQPHLRRGIENLLDARPVISRDGPLNTGVSQ